MPSDFSITPFIISGSKKSHIRNNAPNIAMFTRFFSSNAIDVASTTAIVPAIMFREDFNSSGDLAEFTSTVL
ncbi:hypothetical protein D3C71_1716070 [compost metagenome]